MVLSLQAHLLKSDYLRERFVEKRMRMEKAKQMAVDTIDQFCKLWKTLLFIYLPMVFPRESDILPFETSLRPVPSGALTMTNNEHG